MQAMWIFLMVTVVGLLMTAIGVLGSRKNFGDVSPQVAVEKVNR